MNVLRIEPGFIKRNYKSIFKSFLSNADVFILMSILVCAIGYLLSAISDTLPDQALYAPVIGVLMVAQAFPAVFLIYCTMFLCARRDGQLRSSTFSILVTSAADTLKTFKSHKTLLIVNVIIFSIIYSIMIYLKKSAPSAEETKIIVDSSILAEMDRYCSKLFLSVYFFGIIMRSQYSLLSFYMFNSLTQRYFNTSEDAACASLKNAETLNFPQSLIGITLQQLVPLAGILLLGTLLAIPYLICLIGMYHVWLEMYVGPGKTVESKEKETVLDGELTPLPIKN